MGEKKKLAKQKLVTQREKIQMRLWMRKRETTADVHSHATISS